METIKIGVGTFIIRDDAKANLHQALSRLKAIGYEGAELLGFFGAEPNALAAMLKSLDLQALGNHVQVTDFLNDPEGIIKDHWAINCRRITLACSKEQAESTPFDTLRAQFAQAARLCLAAGIVPMYHNHDFDMLGESPFAQRLLDAVPELVFEPDVGWMVVAGKDPKVYLQKYKDRIHVIHLKDVFLEENGFTFRPTGYGCVNTPALMPWLLACKPQWLMVDHDYAYDRDSYDDLMLSLAYVKALMQVAI